MIGLLNWTRVMFRASKSADHRAELLQDNYEVSVSTHEQYGWCLDIEDLGMLRGRYGDLVADWTVAQPADRADFVNQFAAVILKVPPGGNRISAGRAINLMLDFDQGTIDMEQMLNSIEAIKSQWQAADGDQTQYVAMVTRIQSDIYSRPIKRQS